MNITLTFKANGYYACDGAGTLALAFLADGLTHLQQKGCETCPRYASCRMSHWTGVQTEIRDIDALRAACTELGFILVADAEARGFSKARLAAQFVIRLRGPYDIACNRAENGTYALTTDWWKGHVAKEVGEDYGRLLQLYGVHKATTAARAKGYLTTRRNLADGNIQLSVTGV
jgi:Protein of unknown function (DUF1257)